MGVGFVAGSAVMIAGLPGGSAIWIGGGGRWRGDLIETAPHIVCRRQAAAANAVAVRGVTSAMGVGFVAGDAVVVAGLT